MEPSRPAAAAPSNAEAGDPAIEGLRGFAALLVVATHFAHLLTERPGAWGFASTGVDLFFVLSGYVFAPYLLGKPLPLRPHLVRRAFRLLPLYLAALLLYVGLHQPADEAWRHFWVHVLMLHTLGSTEVAFFYNPAFWSLPPEVEFYLLLPLLAWLARRTGVLALALAAAALHLLLVAAATPGDTAVDARALATVHAPGLLIEFLLGTLAHAALLRWPQPWQAMLRLGAGLAVLAAMVAVYVAYVAPEAGGPRTVPPWIGGNLGLGAALGYALAVSGIAARAARAPRWLLGTLLRLGAWSYGIYLFHNAAPRLLKLWLPEAAGLHALLLCIAITWLLALAGHHAIEKPLRSYGRRLSRRLQAAPAFSK